MYCNMKIHRMSGLGKMMNNYQSMHVIFIILHYKDFIFKILINVLKSNCYSITFFILACSFLLSFGGKISNKTFVPAAILEIE